LRDRPLAKRKASKRKASKRKRKRKRKFSRQKRLAHEVLLRSTVHPIGSKLKHELILVAKVEKRGMAGSSGSSSSHRQCIGAEKLCTVLDLGICQYACEVNGREPQKIGRLRNRKSTISKPAVSGNRREGSTADRLVELAHSAGWGCGLGHSWPRRRYLRGQERALVGRPLSVDGKTR
jgi:hypothetical protein